MLGDAAPGGVAAASDATVLGEKAKAGQLNPGANPAANPRAAGKKHV
jgi:hypothetical protein